MTKKAIKPKAWTKLNAQELADATKEFDKPVRFEDTRPMTTSENARWERARRPAVNMPFKSGKSRKVTLNLDPQTLKRCEAYAAKHHLSVSDVINMGLATMFQFAD